MMPKDSTSPPPELTAAFAAGFARSMPADYRARFELADVVAHARIALRRGRRATWVEPWGRLARATAVCVIADDAPGLLSLITASILVHGLNVVTAQVYCRTNERGRREAVDLFWLTRSEGTTGNGPVEDADLARVADVLDSLVSGKTSVDAARRRAEDLRDQADASATRVWFSAGTTEGLSELFVVTRDRPGVLFAIAMALSAERVQIMRSAAAISRGIASDRFLVAEVDGRPIGEARQAEVRARVLTAIDTCRKQGAA